MQLQFPKFIFSKQIERESTITSETKNVNVGARRCSTLCHVPSHSFTSCSLTCNGGLVLGTVECKQPQSHRAIFTCMLIQWLVTFNAIPGNVGSIPTQGNFVGRKVFVCDFFLCLGVICLYYVLDFPVNYVPPNILATFPYFVTVLTLPVLPKSKNQVFLSKRADLPIVRNSQLAACTEK